MGLLAYLHSHYVRCNRKVFHFVSVFKVADAGRVVIPAELPKEFGIDDGEEIVFGKDEVNRRRANSVS